MSCLYSIHPSGRFTVDVEMSSAELHSRWAEANPFSMHPFEGCDIRRSDIRFVFPRAIARKQKTRQIGHLLRVRAKVVGRARDLLPASAVRRQGGLLVHCVWSVYLRLGPVPLAVVVVVVSQLPLFYVSHATDKTKQNIVPEAVQGRHGIAAVTQRPPPSPPSEARTRGPE